jgi:hypothetical protein
MPLQPANADPTVLRAPKNLSEAVIQIPQRDPDGNPLGGVRLPDMEAPLGVHGAQNDPLSFSCSLIGAFVPFSPERLAALYPTQSAYIDRIRVAARAAQAEGFLLPDDAAIIVNAIEAAPVFKEIVPVGPPR